MPKIQLMRHKRLKSEMEKLLKTAAHFSLFRFRVIVGYFSDFFVENQFYLWYTYINSISFVLTINLIKGEKLCTKAFHVFSPCC